VQEIEPLIPNHVKKKNELPKTTYHHQDTKNTDLSWGSNCHCQLPLLLSFPATFDIAFKYVFQFYPVNPVDPV
jgi:hypothetical protein